MNLEFRRYDIGGSFGINDNYLKLNPSGTVPTIEDEDQNHIINIDVIDHAGNETSLYPISVFVNNIEEPDLTPPSIVIYDPASNLPE